MLSPVAQCRHGLYRILRSVDVKNEEEAARIIDMIGNAVFKNLAMRVRVGPCCISVIPRILNRPTDDQQCKVHYAFQFESSGRHVSLDREPDVDSVVAEFISSRLREVPCLHFEPLAAVPDQMA